jgi:RNA polymerase sigma-70 factor, ECF subfamily
MAQNAPAGWDRTVQQRLCSGEAAALGETYDRFASLVHGLALRVLTEDAAADRVTGEVFARLWQSPQDYDPARGPLRSWLAGLAHGLAVQRLRARRTAVQGGGLGGGGAQHGAADVEDTVRTASVAVRADHLLASMPAQLRAALDLAYVKRHDCRRTAAELGITEAETHHRLRLALQVMATAYDTGPLDSPPGHGTPVPRPDPSPGHGSPM